MSYVVDHTWYAHEEDGGMKLWNGRRLPEDLLSKHPRAYCIAEVVDSAGEKKEEDGDD